MDVYMEVSLTVYNGAYSLESVYRIIYLYQDYRLQCDPPFGWKPLEVNRAFFQFYISCLNLLDWQTWILFSLSYSIYKCSWKFGGSR